MVEAVAITPKTEEGSEKDSSAGTEPSQSELLFKVVIIGESGVGKSCLLYRATSGSFRETYEVTIGAAFGSFTSRCNGRPVKLQIWDTAGQENFRSMVHVFYKGAHTVILVYDITRRDSFERLEDWLTEIMENASAGAKVALVGSQKDREDMREVATEVGEAFARKHGLAAFLETSAKTGEGITELFEQIVSLLCADRGTAVAPTKKKKRLVKGKKGKRAAGGKCC